MARYRLSNKAESDLRGIVKYAIQNWGLNQASAYPSDLRLCLDQIAAYPFSRRPCSTIPVGYRRVECGRHVVFYRIMEDGDVLVSRVLHSGMLPQRHPL